MRYWRLESQARIARLGEAGERNEKQLEPNVQEPKIEQDRVQIVIRTRQIVVRKRHLSALMIAFGSWMPMMMDAGGCSCARALDDSHVLFRIWTDRLQYQCRAPQCRSRLPD